MTPPEPELRQLSPAVLAIFVIEALPIPFCGMAGVFALTSPGIFFQPVAGTLLVWAIVFYPIIWLATFLSAKKLAARGQHDAATMLIIIPGMIILPALAVVLSF